MLLPLNPPFTMTTHIGGLEVGNTLVNGIFDTSNTRLRRYRHLALRKVGFAGTGRATFPTERWLSPERDKPRSLRKDGFADKLLVGKGSDSYFVYFASLRSE